MTVVLAFVAGVAVLMTTTSVAMKASLDRQRIAIHIAQKRVEIAEREVAILARKLRQSANELKEANRRLGSQTQAVSEQESNTESESDKIARAIRSAAYEQSRAIQDAARRARNAETMRRAR